MRRLQEGDGRCQDRQGNEDEHRTVIRNEKIRKELRRKKEKKEKKLRSPMNNKEARSGWTGRTRISEIHSKTPVNDRSAADGRWQMADGRFPREWEDRQHMWCDRQVR